VHWCPEGARKDFAPPGGLRIACAGPTMSTAARRALQPFDLVLRHHKTYTWVRRAVLGLSLLCAFGRALDAEAAVGRAPLFPVPDIFGAPGAIDVLGLELIDPLPLLALALSNGPSWALLWLALPALILVALFGRFFCGWVCPYVPLLAASNAARGILTRLGVPLLDVKLPRSTSAAVLVAVLAGTALFGAQLAPLIYPPSLIGREVFRAVFYGGLGAGAALVALAFCFDTFVSRAGFCRTLCPGGALYSALGAASPYTVRLDKSRCTDCTACDVVCNLGQSPMTGRIDSGCERCGKCVAVCPTDALAIGLKRRAK
jgi:ferredoxin-type protein NapH